MTIQKTILGFLEKKLRETGFSEESICRGLRIFHVFIPLLAAFLIFFGSKKMVLYTIFANLIIFIMFISFRGCILSRLEKRFCNENYTVMDPVLKYFDIEANDKNRYQYSIYSALTCFVGSGLIYYLRFIYM